MDINEAGVAFGIMYSYLIKLDKKGKHRTEGRKWVKSDSTTYGTFMWCCRQLNLDIIAARTRLLKKRKDELHKIIKAFEMEKQRQEEELV